MSGSERSIGAMRPGRETVEELLARAPKSAPDARPRLVPPVEDELEAEGGEAALVVALRARLERAAIEIVREPRFAAFRRARSGYRLDETARGVGAWIELRRED